MIYFPANPPRFLHISPGKFVSSVLTGVSNGNRAEDRLLACEWSVTLPIIEGEEGRLYIVGDFGSSTLSLLRGNINGFHLIRSHV